jgi:prolyl-tRNA synthetase
LLDDIQKNLLYKADSMRKARTVVATDWKEFVSAIEANNFVLAYWNGDAGVEEKIKKETTATIRCIPFDQGESSGTCVYSGKPATIRAIFAKAY